MTIAKTRFENFNMIIQKGKNSTPGISIFPFSTITLHESKIDSDISKLWNLFDEIEIAAPHDFDVIEANKH